MNQKIASLKDEISQEKQEWSEKTCVIQAIGETIEQSDSFIESFLNCENFQGESYGVLWLNPDIDYIPSKTLKILGENGMNVIDYTEKVNETNSIEFK